jgi:sn-glycerol 3-phosphate transport system ATP-binding protein
MVYVTHDQDEAITMADQVVLMNSGHIEQVATPRDLYLRPATIFAAKFIGTPPMNILSSSMLGDFGRALEARSGAALSIGIRPEAFAIVDQSPLEFVVTGVEYLGADALLHGDISGAAAIIRVSGQTLPETGSRLPVAVSDRDLHLFDPVSGRRKDVPDIGSILFRSGMPPVGTTGAGAPFFKPEDD